MEEQVKDMYEMIEYWKAEVRKAEEHTQEQAE
jgi:hypothetical protein